MSMSKKSRNRGKLAFILSGIMAVSIVMAAVGIYELNSYEKSVLEIYAAQQDAYVQLVLDQINLQPERTDEEIIDDILGAVDGSDQKYWTLSSEGTILYVKDITETNRYKGFTTPSFYTSDSASRFVEGLSLNQVTHKIVQMEDTDYVASGTIFDYNKEQYTVCLLTNESFILDNNDFLTVKITMWIYLGILLVLLLLITMILVYMLEKRERRIAELNENMEVMYREREELEREISFMDSFHSRWSLFEENMMPEFIRKLHERNVCPVTMTLITCKDIAARNEFLEQAQLLLDEKVLRFTDGECGVRLVFVQYDGKEASQMLERVSGVSVNEMYTYGNEPDKGTLLDVFERFMENTGEARRES